MRKLILLLAVLADSFITTSRFPHFPFQDFITSEAPILPNNSPSVVFGATHVNPDVNGAKIESRAGPAAFNRTFNLWGDKGKNRPFNATFGIAIASQADPGGYGFPFVFTIDPTAPPESHGQWLEIVNPSLTGSAQAKPAAIQFGTTKRFPIVDENRIGLKHMNSVYSRNQSLLKAFEHSRRFKSNVTNRYDGEHLSVFASNEQIFSSPIFSEEADLGASGSGCDFIYFSPSSLNNSTHTKFSSLENFSLNYPAKASANRRALFALASSVTIGVSVGIAVAVFVWCRSKHPKRINEENNNIEDEIVWLSVPSRINYMELSIATNGFNEANFLGEGGFGTVYKGVINGDVVAVKKIKKGAAQGKKEFIAEVTTIGNMNHRNLVKLVGWCCEKAEYLLVYEYMANGSLERFISSENETLSLKTRIHVLSGVAQAVAYLHGGCRKMVFHRDIKPSNIMLDSDFNAKLGDFGLARTVKDNRETHHSTTQFAGTMGYLAPEFPFSLRSTAQTDVYSFGVVTLEVACGRRLRDEFIVNWVWDLYENDKIGEAADARLKEDFSNKEEIQCLLMLGLACCHPNPFERPSMAAVVKVLMGDAPVQDVQKERPRFVWPVILPVCSDLSIAGSDLASIDGR